MQALWRALHALRPRSIKGPLPTFFPSLSSSDCQINRPTSLLPLQTLPIMSSPTQRRSDRPSANNTSRRASQRNSQAPQSSPAQQQQQQQQQNTEADGGAQRSSPAPAQDQTTPRGNARSSQTQAPPTSSPLFFRSSPAQSESQSQSQQLGVPVGANGAGASSPLRQEVGAGPGGSSEGGRTPRANGGIGGEIMLALSAESKR